MGKKKLLAFVLAIIVGVSFSFVILPDVYAGHTHTYKTTYSKYCQKQHTVTKKCTKCSYKTSYREAHSYKLIKYSELNGTYHNCQYKCSKCGQYKMTKAKHSFKGKKCTKCGYVKGAKG